MRNSVYLVNKEARTFVALSALPVSRCYCEHRVVFEIHPFVLIKGVFFTLMMVNNRWLNNYSPRL